MVLPLNARGRNDGRLEMDERVDIFSGGSVEVRSRVESQLGERNCRDRSCTACDFMDFGRNDGNVERVRVMFDWENGERVRVMVMGQSHGSTTRAVNAYCRNLFR